MVVKRLLYGRKRKRAQNLVCTCRNRWSGCSWKQIWLDSRRFLRFWNTRQISSKAANFLAGSDSLQTCWNGGRRISPICGMTRRSCRNSTCRKKIWRKSLQEWSNANWKIMNDVPSLFRTLCNFGTRSGCYQKSQKVRLLHEDALILQNMGR